MKTFKITLSWVTSETTTEIKAFANEMSLRKYYDRLGFSLKKNNIRYIELLENG